MRILIATTALSLLFTGCVDPRLAREPSAMENGDADFGPDKNTDASDDDQNSNEDPPGNDEEPPAGDDGDPPVDGWDASPPVDAPDGSTLTTVITCGLLDGPHEKVFEKSGEVWLEVESIGDGPFEDLYPCMTRGGDGSRGDKYMIWDEDPSMYLNAAGLDHDLVPMETTDRWIGEVAPMNEPSRECVDALAERGLSFPITMTLEVLEMNLVD